MKRFRLFQLAAVFLLSAGWLAADCLNCAPGPGDFAVSLNNVDPFSSDPRISIGDGCCSSDVGQSFQLQANTDGGGSFVLRNISDQTFGNLNFFADFGQTINPDSFSCDPGPFFGTCDITTNGTTVNFLFSGGPGISSAPPIFLLDPPIQPEFGGVGGWLGPNGEPLILNVQANVPEPSTFVLLLSVAGVVAARRRLQKSRS
jgi:PEP-CTERM motif-containing protein